MGKQLEGFGLDVGEERNGEVTALELTLPGSAAMAGERFRHKEELLPLRLNEQGWGCKAEAVGPSLSSELHMKAEVAVTRPSIIQPCSSYSTGIALENDRGTVGLGVRLLSPAQYLCCAERHWTKSLQSKSCLSFPVT